MPLNMAADCQTTLIGNLYFFFLKCLFEGGISDIFLSFPIE